MPKIESEPSLLAVCDQIQAVCQSSARNGEVNVIGFMVVTDEGLAEFRSPMPYEELKALFKRAVEEL